LQGDGHCDTPLLPFVDHRSRDMNPGCMSQCRYQVGE
jgi:hypothetical protein